MVESEMVFTELDISRSGIANKHANDLEAGFLVCGSPLQTRQPFGAARLALLLLAAQRVPARQVDDQSIELLN